MIDTTGVSRIPDLRERREVSDASSDAIYSSPKDDKELDAE